MRSAIFADASCRDFFPAILFSKIDLGCGLFVNGHDIAGLVKYLYFETRFYADKISRRPANSLKPSPLISNSASFSLVVTSKSEFLADQLHLGLGSRINCNRTDMPFIYLHIDFGFFASPMDFFSRLLHPWAPGSQA